MKKLTAVLSVALLVSAVLSSFAFAGSGALLGGPQRLLLSRTAGAAAITSGSDTITVLSAADSVRTSNISTTGWNWGLLNSTSAATAPVAIAKIDVWVDPGTDGLVAGDSLNFVIEPSYDGGATYVRNLHPKATAMGAAALGNCIVMRIENGGLYIGSGGATGSGYLIVDPDAGPTLISQSYYPFMLRNFRLKIFGDSAPIGPLHVSVTPLAVVQ